MAWIDRRFMHDREGDDEREWDLAGATSDLEEDRAYYDSPGFIEGGQGI